MKYDVLATSEVKIRIRVGDRTADGVFTYADYLIPLTVQHAQLGNPALNLDELVNEVSMPYYALAAPLVGFRPLREKEKQGMALDAALSKLLTNEIVTLSDLREALQELGYEYTDNMEGDIRAEHPRRESEAHNYGY